MVNYTFLDDFSYGLYEVYCSEESLAYLSKSADSQKSFKLLKARNCKYVRFSQKIYF